MKKTKRIFAALLAALILSLSACSDGDTASVSDVATDGTGSSSVTDSTVISDSTTGSTVQTSDSSSQTTAPTATAQTPATDATNTPTEAPSVSVNSDKQGITASYTIASTWEDGGSTCSQLDFTVRNDTGSTVGSWTVEIDLGQNVEIVQGWNAELTANGSVLKAKNVEYNGELANSAETPFGCIIKTPSEIGNTHINTDSSTPTPEQTTVATTTSQSEVTKPDIGIIETNGGQGLVSEHGQLSVRGADLVDESGAPMQLRGVSTHGIQWFPQFANKEAFRWLRDEWGTNTMRLAMYSGESEGYTSSTKDGIEKTVQDAVDACIELDMYVIIDWHILADQSPQVRKADALRFFDYISKKYAEYPNVIYEICNEPNGYASWNGDVKPYAEEVIPVIRANDPDSVVIVGTPTWSQDIDKALADPLKFDNVMYALHYYADTHTDWLRDRARNCYNSGLPIFISEFGNCDASGGGRNNFDQASKWLELIEELNLSYMTWALSDKNETCSLLTPGAPANGGWTDDQLSENGRFMRDWFTSH